MEYRMVCCWCGKDKLYVVDLPYSISTDASIHGPHFQLKTHYVSPEEP